MKKIKLINPTGNGEIRPRDVWGSGDFLAKVVGPEKINRGIGLICVPGQPVLSPMEGMIYEKKLKGNEKSNFSCVEIINNIYKVILKYVVLKINMNKKHVNAGDVIGIAQDISGKYGYSIIPHVILEFWVANDPTNLLKNGEIAYEIFTDNN
jgi:hypothetical protein